MAITNSLDIEINVSAKNAAVSLDLLTQKLGALNTGFKATKTPGNNTTNVMDAIFRSSSKTHGMFSKLNSVTYKLASTFGMLYAAAFPFVRLSQKIWGATQDAMDYVETYNYFRVTMTKIGATAGENFSKAYLKQVADLNQKMTGFALGKNGELIDADMKNLGLDPETLMNFQARIGAVTNSVGLLADASVSTQKALTMLAADLSSLTNTDLDSVMTNLSSGLIGQSRALYKYGIDITNATLATYAYKYGIEKSVSAMTQAEKMQLRVLAILDQSKVAWADQINTLDSVANQYRVLKQQVSNLGRVLGNLFLPIVKTVLPYLNAMVIVLRKILEYIGFSFYGSSWLKNLNDGISDADFTPIEDGFDDVTDAENEATKAAKEYKKAVLGIDELNIISPDEGASSSTAAGGGSFDLSKQIADALADYEKIWNEAFENMNNKAQELADAFLKYFEEGNYKGLGLAISSWITNALKSIEWEKVFSVAESFGKGFAEFLNGLLTPDLFGEVGKTIANSLNTAIYLAVSFLKNFDFYQLGEAIATGLNSFFETFDFAALADMLNKWVDGLETAIGAALENFSWIDAFKAAGDFFSNIEIDTLAVIIGILAVKKIGKVAIADAVKEAVITKVGTWLSAALSGISIKQIGISILSILPTFAGTAAFDTFAFEIMAQIDDALTKLFPTLSKIVGEGLLSAIETAIIGSVIPGIGTLAGFVAGAIAGTLNSIDSSIFSFEWTSEWFTKAIEHFKTAFDGNRQSLLDFGGLIFDGIIEGFLGVITFIVEPVARFFDALWKAICDIFGIRSPAKNMMPIGQYLMEGIIQGFMDTLTAFNQAIYEWYQNSVKPWFTVNKWQEIGKGIKTGLSNVWNSFATWWSRTAIVSWWNNDVTPWFSVNRWTFDGVRQGLTNAFNNAISSVQNIWNRFANALNDKLSFTIEPIIVQGKTVFEGTTLNLGRIPTFATGGFPENENGLFFANSTELVGTFTNGKTAVANNDQIVEGIKTGVSSAVQDALVPYLLQIASNTKESASKELSVSISDRDIARASIRGQRSLGKILRTT